MNVRARGKGGRVRDERMQGEETLMQRGFARRRWEGDVDSHGEGT
jgi:hypothetical protein